MDIRGPQDIDLLVIGGGLVGAGIARDAAGRGLAVCLAERGDLAENICAEPEPEAVDTARADPVERERLRANVAHLIEASMDTQPHVRAERPRWFAAFLPARDEESDEFRVDTARLVVLTALDAAEHGAQIRTRTDCVRLIRKREHWAARLKGPQGVQDITARQVVFNAGEAVSVGGFAWAPDDAEAKESEALRLDRGWDARAPALLCAADTSPEAARALAERALALLGAPGPAWTAIAPLPGGDIPDGDFDAFLEQQVRFFPWLPPATLLRMARAYGTRLPRVLGDARGFADLGQHFGGGLTAAEVIYLIHHEFARSAEDVLWRRSKLALHLTPDECERLVHWFERSRIDDAAINAAILSARAG